MADERNGLTVADVAALSGGGMGGFGNGFEGLIYLAVIASMFGGGFGFGGFGNGGARVMKIIEKLSEFIDEEIADAEKYVKLAIEHKGTNDELAKVFYVLSTEEMEHMSRLHNCVVNMINEYRAKNGDAPPEMKMVYDILHRRHIDGAGTVKALQMLYKEQ